MLRQEEILSTIGMLQTEHLDVHAVTLGIDLNECSGPDLQMVCRKISHKITTRAARLVEVCQAVGGRYQIPIVNKRLAVSPISLLLEGHNAEAALEIARTLDESAARVGVDLVGGGSPPWSSEARRPAKRCSSMPWPPCSARPSESVPRSM